LKGQHWRKPKLFWDKKWFEDQYYNLGKNYSDIAKEFNITSPAIRFWAKKHQIKSRTISEIRSKKYWGLKGKQNAMFGRLGKDNPNWDGGHSPERQTKYARYFWKELAKTILKKDNYKCQNCGDKNKLVIHHIKKWSCYPELRFEVNNLITLCENCHKLKHKKK